MVYDCGEGSARGSPAKMLLDSCASPFQNNTNCRGSSDREFALVENREQRNEIDSVLVTAAPSQLGRP